MDKKYEKVPTEEWKNKNQVEDGGKTTAFDKQKPDTLFLYLTIISANLLVLNGGMGCSWPSPVLPKLLSNDTNINPLPAPITPAETSVIVGAVHFFGLIGPLLTPHISSAIGRKKSLLIIGLIDFVSSIFLAFSTSYMFITIGRIIFCIGFFGIMTLMPVYISEICENHNRSKFGCMFSANLPLGTLLSFFLGPKFSYKIFTLLTAAPLILFFSAYMFICETPLYSLSKGRVDECMKTLKRLRSNKTDTELKEDYEEIVLTLKTQKLTAQASLLTVIKSKEGRVGLLLSILTVYLTFGCGIPTVASFLNLIFNTIDTGISGDSAAFICSTVQALSIILATFIIEKTGKRILLLISTFCCGIALVILGICFMLNYNNSPLFQKVSWLPLCAMIFYFFIYSTGVGPVGPAIPGELFAPEFRRSAMIVVGIIGVLTPTLIGTAFPFLSSYAGVHCCFFVLSVSCVIGGILTLVFLPETTGRSIIEIQQMLIEYKVSFKNICRK